MITLLHDQCVIEEISKEFLEPNENENKTHQNLWGTAKAVIRRKFIATMCEHLNKKKKSEIST
jgi:hypothetical protein